MGDLMVTSALINCKFACSFTRKPFLIKSALCFFLHQAVLLEISLDQR